jgi:SAM-dependent methyltransferase
LSAEDHRRAVYEVAKAIAPGWERQRARIEAGVAPVREWVIRELAPRPADTVLELAAGAAAAARSSSSQTSTTVMHAERIELDADSVDGVLCRFGYMLMADPEAALSETRRVLRPGGRSVLPDRRYELPGVALNAVAS